MDVFSCAAAATALGGNCLSTLKALHSLYERYRNARSTIAALHCEITVIGASMQYINVIFEQHTDLAKTRFYNNPELEQTFSAALAGCSLILSCLDEEVEKIIAGMGPEDSKGLNGKARLLLREEAMKDLLCTIRGQHSAIFSIIQCLQVQNIAELGMKIENLRVIVSGNHHGVEQTVRRSPSVCRLQMNTPGLLDATRHQEHRKLDSSTTSTSEGIKSTISSSERVAISYKHYHATMSNVSRQPSSRSRSSQKTTSWNNDGSTDEAASVRGLAPSTIRAPGSSREEDFPSDRQSIISAISASSWTLEWLEESKKAVRRMQSTISMPQILACDAENSIVASDSQTFLEHIRYFMPVLADFDITETPLVSDGQTIERSDASAQADPIAWQYSPIMDARTGDEVLGRPADELDGLESRLLSGFEPSPQLADEKKRDVPSNNSEHMISKRSLSSLRDEGSLYGNGYPERLEIVNSRTEEGGMEYKVAEESGIATHRSELVSLKTKPASQTIMGISIYVEKHLHQRGTVICSSATDNTLRVRHSFSQALAPELQGSGTQISLPYTSIDGCLDASQPSRLLLHSIGARVFFVQRPTDPNLRIRDHQDVASVSDSEPNIATGAAHSHKESPLRIISALQPQSTGAISRPTKRPELIT